ncbi:ABC transporter permease [Rhodospirillaceae bacterium KN72]|uniref:ABC transporter permease n=1 Tax=Pacificispira spongiicola TaxID=2729598 RepID=A0A7Y0HHT8_9PROT|nr:ABC transporter permease [Pacificispira spongiicola]NMM46237.1 ABC transporter permease [Pacificispira spongiicola]
MSKILATIAQRLGLGLVTLFVVTLIIAGMIEALPGDFCQAILGQSATESTVQACRRENGFDQPFVTRYVTWLGNTATLDLGTSLSNKRDVGEFITVRLENTLFLAAFAAIVAVPLALTLGILAALYRYSWYDRFVNVFTLTSISFPEFLVGYIMILLLSVMTSTLEGGSWFPALATVRPETSFADRVHLVFLPAMTLTLVVVAHMMRMTRAAIINLLASPYIEMARLKGIKNSRIIVKHALPNALAPIVNVVAINLAYLIVGVVVVEVVFTYPGLGKSLVDAVKFRDIPVVQASCMIFALTYILLNLTADVLSIVSNPRLLHPR